MAEKEREVKGCLTQESIKVIAECVGVSSLNEEAGTLLADDVTFRLKMMVQVRTLISFFKLVSRQTGCRPRDK